MSFNDGGPPPPIEEMARASFVGTFPPSDAEDPRRASERDDGLHSSSSTSSEDGDAPSSVPAADDVGPSNGEARRFRRPVSERHPERRRRMTVSEWKAENAERARARPKDGGGWPKMDSLSFTRSLAFYGQGYVTEENEAACRSIDEARKLRRKYRRGSGVRTDPSLSSARDGRPLAYSFGPDGTIDLTWADAGPDGPTPLVAVPSIDEFATDYRRLAEVAGDGAVRSFSFQRLRLLSHAFKTHVTANAAAEQEAQSALTGTDFYRIMKVDNHIHAAAACSGRQFMQFVKQKLNTEGDTIVHEGKTLERVFREADIDPDRLTVDAFSVLADSSVYQRFDNFNGNFSPFRMAHMRKIFLKSDNALGGRYFAELLKAVLARHEASKGHNSAAEMRLSIYGMEREEWAKLARWVMRDWEGEFPGPLLSDSNRWMIQVPRLWRIYCAKNKPKGGTHQKKTFQDMIENIFAPIMDATLYPEKDPILTEFLKHVVGFDSVDDEGAAEEPCCSTRPSVWDKDKNPNYSWQLYFLWANIEIVNRLRRAKGLNEFSFRPHAGETGDVMHLAVTYMLCASINHGINLDDQVSLQYLYYLDQVGLSISPLSNNFLFRKIASSPFPKFFKRGLNVTLSTDDPLLFHMSDDALLEEYSVARASFDLSMTDISEIARNSVLQSGFSDGFKRRYLGDSYKLGVTLCDESKTHVPLIRSKYRAEHLAQEQAIVKLLGCGAGNEVLKNMMEQYSNARDEYRKVFLDHFAEDQEPFYL